MEVPEDEDFNYFLARSTLPQPDHVCDRIKRKFRNDFFYTNGKPFTFTLENTKFDFSSNSFDNV